MKKKIAFTFPHLYEFGGGEIFCEYLTNYLVKYYNVDLFYYSSYGINKRIRFDKKIKIIGIKSNNFIINFFCKNYIFIAHLYLLLFLQSKKYHFVFSGAGEFFHPNKCFQYIHHPFYSLNISHYLSLGLKRKNFIKILLRFIFSFAARLFIFVNNSKYSKTITLVNSKFIKERFLNIYKNNKLKIVYPTFKIPNILNENFSKYENRKNDFVILGRVSKDKNTIEAAKFFSNFNKKNRILNLGKLHIIGPIEKKLKKEVKKLIAQNNNLHFHGYLSLKKRNKILKKSKYGLHFFVGEHFGRSILEMQKFGIIVFCHDSGGAMEIVSSKLQKFTSYIDLENKIKKVIDNISERKKIKKMINRKILKYSDREFRKNILKALHNE